MTSTPGAVVSDWQVVVPMARLATAKSRLRQLGDRARRDLALAMLLDTVTAAAATGARVCVATPDPVVAAAVREDVPASGVVLTSGAGLNGDLTEVVDGLEAAPVAVLLGDLPTVTSDGLSAVLDAAAAVRRGVVADATGWGTTLLAALDPRDLRPWFGPGSYRRHRATGAAPLPADARLRRDVDQPADLAAIALLGPGPRTCRVLESIASSAHGGAA